MPPLSFALGGGISVFPGVTSPVELPAPLGDETYVVTKTAAELMGVTPSTITHWRTNGYLAPIPGSPPHKPLYRWADVIEAEYLARQAAIRTSGTDKRVRRTIAA